MSNAPNPGTEYANSALSLIHRAQEAEPDHARNLLLEASIYATLSQAEIQRESVEWQKAQSTAMRQQVEAMMGEMIKKITGLGE